MAELTEGKKAPVFSLPDQSGKEIALKDFKGKTVVLYFYPKDMTPGCTQEGIDFQENLDKLKKKKTVVLGISKDSVDRHKKFADKYGYSFSLLSDENSDICEKYGVWKEKNMYGKKFMGIVRTTVIINGEGEVQKIYSKVKVKGHVEVVLAEL